MDSSHACVFCYKQIVDHFANISSYSSPYVNITNQDLESMVEFCNEIRSNSESYLESKIERENEYSKPMELIGIYISIASLFCILAMALDLFNGFRNRRLWFPTKYFSLNAASITVITVAMKLPVDLTSSMPGMVDQVAKFGGMAFMCTMMSNLMPSLASMDNKSLFANVTGLVILVIMLIVNIFIQIRTHVVNPNMFHNFFIRFFRVEVPYIYMGMLLFLLLILISSAITIPTSKRTLEFKYQATSKTTLNDQRPQENQIYTVEELRQLVKRYWIMAETGNPQFLMVSNPLSSATGIICAISMVLYMFLVWELFMWHKNDQTYESVYKRSMFPIVITQSIGIVVGSVAPIFRCFIVLIIKSFDNQNRKHFQVFKVEKYWTKKLCEWKEKDLSFFSRGHRSRALLHNLKNFILSFCIGFQKVIVVSCKIIGLLPTVVIIFVIYCLHYYKSLKTVLLTPPTPSSSSDTNGTNEDLSKYVLLLEDDVRLAEKTVKGISDSLNRLIRNAEKKCNNNLLEFLEKSVAFHGVETFDTDQVRSLLSVEHVNTWSLPIVSLTCIAIALPNIHKGRADNLFKSVREGLFYTHLVEEKLNKTSVYKNIRRSTVILCRKVEYKCKWLEYTLERSAYEGKTPTEIINLFAHIAEDIVNDFNKSSSGKLVEKENLPLNVIAANSMYRIARTIMHTYESNNLEIVEDELFTRLCDMIADILAACFSNIPEVVKISCKGSTIEKREASVVAAVDLLGRMGEIMKRFEMRELPNMDRAKMGYIDEWRLHLKQP